MNIQIFGTKKSADTRKAERFFKERGIKFQAIDLAQKGFSKGELTSILQAVGGMDDLLDEKTKDREAYLLIKYLADEDKFDKVLEHPLVVKQPVVRNGRQATVGYQPEVWKNWDFDDKSLLIKSRVLFQKIQWRKWRHNKETVLKGGHA